MNSYNKNVILLEFRILSMLLAEQHRKVINPVLKMYDSIK